MTKQNTKQNKPHGEPTARDVSKELNEQKERELRTKATQEAASYSYVDYVNPKERQAEVAHFIKQVRDPVNQEKIQKVLEKAKTAPIENQKLQDQLYTTETISLCTIKLPSLMGFTEENITYNESKNLLNNVRKELSDLMSKIGLSKLEEIKKYLKSASDKEKSQTEIDTIIDTIIEDLEYIETLQSEIDRNNSVIRFANWFNSEIKLSPELEISNSKEETTPKPKFPLSHKDAINIFLEKNGY